MEIVKSEFESYESFKQEFDLAYRSVTENYIRMGYLLKRARDTDILYQSGYKSIAEFAFKEYGLRDDTVSNMIKMNDRYSINGYSDRISEQFEGYGRTLLSEMLTLSDAVIGALPEGIKRETIREIKTEIKEEQTITDLEVMMEQKNLGQQAVENNLFKTLHQYFRENSRQYIELYELVTTSLTKEAALNLLAPSGIGVKMVRIPGVGRMMLSIKGLDRNLELVNVRQNETEEFTWTECLLALSGLCQGSENPRKDWESCYGIPFPEESKPETIQTPEYENPIQETEQKKEPVEKSKKGHNPSPGLALSHQEETKIDKDLTEIVDNQTIPEPPKGEKATQEPETRPEERAQSQSWTGIQDSVEDIPGVMQKPIHEAEQKQWEAAKSEALKIYTDLNNHNFTPDAGIRDLVKSMQASTEQLQNILHALEMSELWPEA